MVARNLNRRLRAASRIALYGSLALVGILATFLLYVASAPLTESKSEDWADVDFESLESVRLLRDYIRIDTSEATGDVAAGARFLGRQLETAGIPFTLEVLGTGDANLWAVLEGESPEAVVLHHHIDVEDIDDPELWVRPPFAAEMDLPWLYGRGAYDMKSVGVAQLLAFIELAKSGARLEKSVILLATSGEERGSDLGTRWILHQHPELVARFGVVLTEGGVVEGRGGGDLKYWGTEFAQKRYIPVVACDPSKERLEALHQDLLTNGAPESILRVTREVRAFLPHYGPTRDRELFRRLLADPERIVRDRPAFEKLPSYVQAMFRNELHPLGVRQTADGGWELPMLLHLLPGVSLEEVRDTMLPEWLFFGVETTVYPELSAAHGSPIDHPALQAIEESVAESYPGAPLGPMFLPWTATDSRFFRAQGIASYGFSPFLVLTTDALRVDRPGERIALPAFVEGVAIYARLLRRLAT